MYCLITLKHEKCLQCNGAVQQTVLPLVVSILQLCMGEPACVSVLHQSVPPKVSGLQQLVLPLSVSVQQQPVLCQEVYGLQRLCCTWTSSLREPVLQLDVFVYPKSFCVHLTT
jgi:hypothetical protein